METLPLINLSVWFIVKIFTLIGLAVYIIFAFVVVKQVKLMNDTLETGLETPILAVSYLHLFYAMALFVISLLVL